MMGHCYCYSAGSLVATQHHLNWMLGMDSRSAAGMEMWDMAGMGTVGMGIVEVDSFRTIADMGIVVQLVVVVLVRQR